MLTREQINKRIERIDNALLMVNQTIIDCLDLNLPEDDLKLMRAWADEHRLYGERTAYLEVLRG